MTFGDDDVARNIWNEQQRDAAPSPEEAREDHRRYLREHGCEADDCEVDDPDALGMHQATYMHECPAVQTQGMPMSPFCEEHVPDVSLDAHLDEMAARAREDPSKDVAALAVYDCGVVEFVERLDPPTETQIVRSGFDDDGQPKYEEVEERVPHAKEEMHVPIEHRCGATLVDVQLLDG